MSVATDVQHIGNSLKVHICDWCAQRIEIAQPYKRWRWYDGGDASTCRLHPECYDAMQSAPHEGGAIEFTMGDNPRGCNCGFDRGCEQCAKRKAGAK